MYTPSLLYIVFLTYNLDFLSPNTAWYAKLGSVTTFGHTRKMLHFHLEA